MLGGYLRQFRQSVTYPIPREKEEPMSTLLLRL